MEVGPKWKLLQQFAAFARAAFESTAEEEDNPQITDTSGSFDGVLSCLAMEQAQAPSGKERAEVPFVAPEGFEIMVGSARASSHLLVYPCRASTFLIQHQSDSYFKFDVLLAQSSPSSSSESSSRAALR